MSAAASQVLSLEELLDAITSCLRNGESLKHCTLVCKSWNVVASRHLFRRLVIDPLTEYVTSDNEHSLGHPCLTLESHPRICSNVRTLSLEPIFWRNSRTIQGHDTRLERFPVQLLQHVIELFPLLERLWISRLPSFTITPESSLPLLPPRTYTLKELCINLDPGVVDDVFITHLLPLFSKPDLFEFNIFMVPDRPGPLHRSLHYTRVPRRVEVTSLSSNWEMTDGKCWAVAEALDVSNMRRLHADDYFPTKGSADCINAVLFNAPHIETFEVNVRLDSTLETEVYGRDVRRGLLFSFQQCRQLRSVSFTMNSFFILNPDYSLHNSYVWEPLLRSLLTAPSSLSTITIVLSFWFRHDGRIDPSQHLHPYLCALNWTLLARILESHPSIVEVNVQLAPESLLLLLEGAPFKKNLSDRVAKALRFSVADY